VFFSFSIVINARYDRWQAVIEQVPDDRVLVETDYHAAGEYMEKRMQEVVKVIAFVKGWTIESCVQTLAQNFDSFSH
jgi:Tat protein secretion system quality control protein TatD with DNase activity